ncbi:MAG TPA: DNA ligase D [Flavitalea sp.]|nr:DNA ligase D [Flavitalea sp.]
MSLSAYKKKRSFNKTPEPEGDKAGKKGSELIFVVQKHNASHLHYDFRLELKGTLKSWAVPKGPSMNPDDKRLAMLVEDHPFDYKDFEGIIPKGNYGAGQVIIWDEGTYEPAQEAASKEAREKILLKEFYSGSLRIRLNGKKLKGEFALVKSSNREENAWLLIKKTDSYSSETDITKKDKSVISGKTIEDIRADINSKQWQSNRKSNGELKEPAKNISKSKKITEEQSPVAGINYPASIKRILAGITKKKKTPFPEDLRPMLATLIDKPFDDPEWIYEVKWDGYRALAYLNKGKVELRSRNNNDFNQKYYPVVEALKQWPVHAVVDGELVVINEKGLSEFGNLQNWKSESDGDLMFYVFDILWLQGVELLDLPLLERRKILSEISPPEGIIRLSESFDASGTEFFSVADKLGLEGIIAKKSDSPYIPDSRTKFWLKIKTEQRHEAVIAGYTRNEDSNKKFSALILGLYENKQLVFIGQVGTGFTDKMQEEILKKLKPLVTKECPFPEEPIINKPTRFRPKPPKAAVVWLRPELVCEVKYQELTADRIMRHPSFQGLRDDKDPLDVQLQKAQVATDGLVEESDKNSPRSDSKEISSEKKVSPQKKQRKSIQPDSENAGSVTNQFSAKDKSERDTLLNPQEETQTKKIDEREIKFTNTSKIYWPKEKISKRDMINYYYQVAPYMLPYMKDRPQSLNRYPNGIMGESFYQKNVAGKVPAWIKTHDYENTTRDGNKTFYVCTDEASLLYIANLGCIEMNPWHSRTDTPDNPDWCVIDLDPDTNSFEQVMEAAHVVRKILEAVDLPSYPKTSGSTGIHIYIPLGAEYTYEQSKQLAELIVTFAHEEMKSFTSLERTPAKRKGKIYLDFLQNRAIQTIAAPYSLRPKSGATASAPLHWDEVKKGLKMQNFTIHNMVERIRSEGDLFDGVLGKGIDLEKVLEKFQNI